MDGLFVKAPLRTIAGLVLLVYYCRGQSQLIGPHEPIIARVGDDVILPCHLNPVMDVVGRTLEWSRSDRNNMFVYVWRSGQEFEKVKHSSYVGRTSLFIDQLSHGNISLKLSKLKLSDRGTYRCFIVDDKKQTFIQLIVAPDSVALPVISLAELDKSSSSVELQCESAGWYPEPELLWLDGDGNLLSAGPTETVRGPDDLYTVSSRVTVDKKHSNKFTCRVQQKNINETREALILIHVPDDFFLIPFSSAVPIIVGLSVSLVVCIMLSLTSGFFLWRRNRTKTKRTLDKTEKDQKKCSQPEADMLMSHEVVEMQDLEQKDTKDQHITLQELQKQQKLQGSKEEMVDDEIEKEKEAVEEEMAHDEDQTRKEAVEEGKSQTEENNQLKGEEAAGSHSIWYLLNPFKGNQSEQQKKLKEAEDELEDLSAEVQTLRDEQKKSEDEKQQLLKKLKEAQEEVNRRWKEVNDIRKESKTQLEEKNAEISTLKREFEKQIWKEKQNVEKWEKELNELLTMDTQRKFQEEKTKRMKAEKELETLKKQLKTKLDGSKSEDVDHQIKSRQQSSRSSDHHGDLRDIILENIDQHCKSVRLKNTSMEEKLLGGCKLELHINNRELSIYTFDQFFKVKAEGKITLWRRGFGLNHAPSGDLVWKDLKPWNPKDQLMFRLISKTGETKVLSLSD